MSKMGKPLLFEVGKPFFLYVAAGIAAVPGGIVYSLLRMYGFEAWWTVVPLLGASLLTSLFVWNYCEKKIRFRQEIPAKAIYKPIFTPLTFGSPMQVLVQPSPAVAAIPLAWPRLPHVLNEPRFFDRNLSIVIRGIKEQPRVIRRFREQPSVAASQLAGNTFRIRMRARVQEQPGTAIAGAALSALLSGRDSSQLPISRRVLISDQLGG